jgi:hypothetical protein
MDDDIAGITTGLAVAAAVSVTMIDGVVYYSIAYGPHTTINPIVHSSVYLLNNPFFSPDPHYHEENLPFWSIPNEMTARRSFDRDQCDGFSVSIRIKFEPMIIEPSRTTTCRSEKWTK